MRFKDIFDRRRRRTVVIVQCRLSSTRLPRKALLPLGGKSLLSWTLAAMKKVRADAYYLAVDVDSAAELEPVAKEAGYSFYAGPKDDVLDRFLKAIELSRADVVVRATADNPFLFHEAASALLAEYREREGTAPVDYITWTGLPHGSGVEIFNAHSLQAAASQTDDPYDHEHVGPALYRHQEKFKCLFLRAPKEFYYPELRTTVDLYSDYRRAQAVVNAVLEADGKIELPVREPFSVSQIVTALGTEQVRYPLLLVPSVTKGHGTGHLRRCLDLALSTGADVLVPEDGSLAEASSLLEEYRRKGLKDWQLLRDCPSVEFYKLAVTDLFVTDSGFAAWLSAQCPVAALDEGASGTDYADYLLDILPPAQDGRQVNLASPSFIPLPKNRRQEADRRTPLQSAIVVLGGEDPAGLSLPAAAALNACGLSVTCIAPSEEKAARLREAAGARLPGVSVTGPVENLKEKLCLYDLVVTHYGFTAFEAAAAGAAVILLGTSPLHERLAGRYGFPCIPADGVRENSFRELLSDPGRLYREEGAVPGDGSGADFAAFIRELSKGRRLPCPVCRKTPERPDPVVARTGARTFRRCAGCGMLYMSWTVEEKQTEYNRAYFYEDYEKQYGKTYEEDFASIKAQGVRRMSFIEAIYRRRHASVTPTILDVGCALGPFMDAANDSGWQVFGIDVSQDAVSRAVSSLVKKGGVFAFSTPSASGVSARYCRNRFFEQSPSDHYTLWEPSRAGAILRRYGFSVKKVVSTGIHPERFPEDKRKFSASTLALASRGFKLGDTFEIYCRKE